MLFFVNCKSIPNRKGYSIRLFQGSKVWNLAKAIEQQDTTEIQKILKDEEITIDYQEPAYGNTLLMTAVANDWYGSAKVLLKNGASPNKSDFYRGKNAVLIASNIGPNYKDIGKCWSYFLTLEEIQILS